MGVPDVTVVVQTFSGETLELEMRSHETVLQLQHRIAQKCRVPPICVMLTVGTDVLQDTGNLQLSDVQKDHGPTLGVTAVLSITSLHRQALEGKPIMREAAVDDLLQVADRDYQGTVEVLIACLMDHVFKVRAAATDALGKIAKRNDARVIAALSARLEDSNAEVRLTALHALGPVLDWDDEGSATDVLQVCFKSHPCRLGDLKVDAIDMIGDFAPHGNEHAVLALIGCLSDRSPLVRCHAINALIKTACHGDQAAVEALCNRTKDINWEVRVGAVKALARLAAPGEAHAVAAASELVHDADPTVQSEALAAYFSLVHP